MNIKIYCCLLAVLFGAFTSCNNKISNEELLQFAEAYSVGDPQTALRMLNRIEQPEKMSYENYMRYIVVKTQSKYKDFQDIRNDTLIFEAQKYFDESSNSIFSTLAHLYSGSVHYERGEKEQALQCYLKSEHRSNYVNHNDLKGRINNNIGYLYYEQNLYEKALTSYHKALHFFEQDKDTANRSHLYNAMGSTHFSKGGMDSAFYYYRKGLDLATSEKNRESIALFKQQLGVVYREQGDFRQSTAYLKEALINTTNTEDSIRVYLNLAKAFNKVQRPDSTTFYVGLIKNRLNKVTYEKSLKNIYGALCEYNLQCKNMNEVLYYSKLNDSISKVIYSQDNAAKLLDAEKAYSLQLKERQLDDEKSRSKLYIVIGVLAFVVALLFIGFFYQRSKRERGRNDLLKVENLLLDSENQLLRTKYELQDTRIYDLAFLQKLFVSIVNKWGEIEKEVKMLRSELGVREKPKLYVELENLIDIFCIAANKELYEWIDDSLEKLSISDSMVSDFTKNEKLLLIFSYYHYNKNDIAEMLNIHQKRIHPLKLNLQRKLKQNNVSLEKIDKILFEETAY